MYALVLLLAMSLTGLTWSFTWYRTAFYKVFGVEVQQQGGHGHGQKESTSKGDARLALQDGKPKAETEGRENAEERGSGRRGRPDRPHRENRKAYPQIIHKVNGRKATCMRAADIGNTSKLNSQSLLFLPLLIGRKYMTS